MKCLVVRQEHDTHPAAAEKPLDLISAQLRARLQFAVQSC